MPHVKPEKGPGPHSTGKDVSPAASRRDNHPGKQKEKSLHESLRKDQQIVADTLGSESFPKFGTADNKKAKKMPGGLEERDRS